MSKSKKDTKKGKSNGKLKPNSVEYFGWTPDTPDHRDLMFSLPEKMEELPPKVDLRTDVLPIFDQGKLGSCTANAVSNAFAFSVNKQQEEKLYVPSRLFIYYNTRILEGNEDRDSGATLRNTVKAMNKVGACGEDVWPYEIPKFTDKPNKGCYKIAKDNKAIKYERLNRSLYDFKSCLASGFPFVGGIAIYGSFQSKEVAKTGMVPMPNTNEKYYGGHAILFMGYDDDKQCFIVRNSWGNKWGDNGHFYLPYEYLLNRNLSDDFWVIQKVT